MAPPDDAPARAHEELGARPPAERIHLPGPSYLPVLVAFGTSLILVGVVVSVYVVVLGAIVLAWTTARWVREARAEMAELPAGPE